MSGRVTNTSDRSQPVTVTVELYRTEEMGVPVADGEDNHEGLAPDDSWAFDVLFGEVNTDEIAGYTVLTD